MNKKISVYHFTQKMEKSYFTILNEKHITENKSFRKFLTFSCQTSWCNLKDEENDFLINNGMKVKMKLNDFFSYAVKNPNISKFGNCDT